MNLSCKLGLLLLLVLSSACAPVAALGVGFRKLDPRDPLTQKPMAGVAFYPASINTGQTEVALYDVNAAQSAPAVSGRFPLIVLSHGSAGSRWDLHGLATYLAARGNIVAAIDHPGDNFRDKSGIGSDRVLIGRALQISALIDFMLAEPNWAAQIDAARIGAAGFSAGGHAALVAAGARPQFELLAQYCASQPRAPEFCGGWSVRVSDPALQPRRDPRIRGLFLMSPVGIYFDRAGLVGVTVPVRLWAAGDDTVLPLVANATQIAALLPRSPAFQLVPGAGHSVFVGPCRASAAAHFADLCTDQRAINRRKIQAQVYADAADFFEQVFKSPQ